MHYTTKKYKEFQEIVDKFNQGKIELFVVEGAPGTGKTSIIKNSLKERKISDYAWLVGRTSAIMLYETAFDYRNCPLYIDDVDNLYKDKDMISLLKSLCQTEEKKLVQWSTKKSLSEGVPTSFITKSRVCIITNRWDNINKHVGAVADRGMILKFIPNATEIHNFAVSQNIIEDEEIYAFFKNHCTSIKNASLRHYLNAEKIKKLGLNWQDMLIESFGVTKDEEIVLSLVKETILETEKATLFAEETRKSERTYYRVKLNLQESGLL